MAIPLQIKILMIASISEIKEGIFRPIIVYVNFFPSACIKRSKRATARKEETIKLIEGFKIALRMLFLGVLCCSSLGNPPLSPYPFKGMSSL
jgi:hypothetical protein